MTDPLPPLTPAPAPENRVFLAGYVAEVEIGAYAEEHGITQRLAFDIDLDVLPNPAPLEDRVGGVINYDSLVASILVVAEGPRLNLLETFAEHLAERLLADPRACRVAIRIAKLDRLPGGARLGCQITRSRGHDAAG